MDRNEFKQTLLAMEPRQSAVVPYEIFDDLFPPGVADDSAKGAAYPFAMAHGCVIDHQPDKREVIFVREKAKSDL